MTSRPKQYNLRSGRTTSVRIPVQLHLQREGVMATEPRTSTQDTYKCQVSVFDSDESSVNIGELLNQDDSDVESDVFSTKYHRFHNDRVVDACVNNSSVTQGAINQTILTQLASTGNRLDKIVESNVCKNALLLKLGEVHRVIFLMPLLSIIQFRNSLFPLYQPSVMTKGLYNKLLRY